MHAYKGKIWNKLRVSSIFEVTFLELEGARIKLEQGLTWQNMPSRKSSLLWPIVQIPQAYKSDSSSTLRIYGVEN